MSKFQKKPVVVEAEQYDGTDECAARLCLAHMFNVRPEFSLSGHFTGRLTVDTLEGRMIASRGDWIITGINGELYPCKPDIFEKTYEAVE